MYAIDFLKKAEAGEAKIEPPTLVTITPDVARNLIDRSKPFRNRRLRMEKLLEYTRSIKEGEWDHTLGEPIHIDVNGHIINGQHRLLAVIGAGVPQRFYVVTGLPTEAANRIDVGATRSHADMLGLSGVQHPRAIAAGLSWIARYEAGSMAHQRCIIPRHKISKYLQDHPDIVQSCEIGLRMREVLPRIGVAIGTHYIFSRINWQEADAFFTTLRNGLGLTADDPVYVLRQRLIDHRNKRQTESECSAVVIKAWNFRRTGKVVERLVWNADREQFPIAI